jgi:hypothetical protein
MGSFPYWTRMNQTVAVIAVESFKPAMTVVIANVYRTGVEVF